MKKAIALVLSIILVFLFAGCSLPFIGNLFGGAGQNAKFVGKWETTVDLADELVKEIDENGVKNPYFNIDHFNIKIFFEFNKDGTFAVTVDQPSVEKAVGDLIASIKDDVVSYLEKYAAVLGLEGTLDQILSETGSSVEEMLESIESSFRNELHADKLFESLPYKGKYKVSGDKVFFTQASDGKFDDNLYDVFKFDNERLILESTTETDSFLKNCYPLIFVKVSKTA